MLRGPWLLSVLALFVAGTLSVDLTEELNSGWRLALRPRQVVTNLQTFRGALGGAPASAITNTGDPDRQFAVDGDTFNDFQTAANRACDNQKNVCAELSNNKTANFPVSSCDQQNEQCKQAAQSSSVKSFETTSSEPALVSSDANFDFFCNV